MLLDKTRITATNKTAQRLQDITLILVLCLMTLMLFNSQTKVIAASSDPFLLMTRYIGGMSLPSVQKSDQKLLQYLQYINPRMTRNNGQIRNYLETLLVNPGLRGLPEQVQIEILLFWSELDSQVHWVVLFPVADKEIMRRNLLTNGLREQETQDELLAFLEERDNVSRLIYIHVFQEELGFLGDSRQSINDAVQLVGRMGNQKFFPEVKSDFFLRIDLGRLAGLAEAQINQALMRLRDDLVQDFLSESAELGGAFYRGVDALLFTIPGVLNQVGLAELSIDISADDIRSKLLLVPNPTRPLSGILAAAKPGTPTLPSLIPDNVVSYSACFPWPELLDPFINNAGNILTTVAGTVIDRDIRDTVSALVRSFQAAGLREYASAIIPPDQAHPETGLTLLYLSRWQQGDNSQAILDQAISIISSPRAGVAPGPVAEFLAQQGVQILVEKKEIDDFAPLKAASLRLEYVSTSPLGLQFDSSFFTGVQEYIILQIGDVVAVAAGVTVDPNVPGRDITTISDSALQVMQSVASKHKTNSARLPFTGKNVLILDAPILLQGALSPLEYAQCALNDIADWRPVALGVEYPESRRQAEELAGFVSSHTPVSYAIERDNQGIAIHLVIPKDAMRDLALATLDLPGM